MLVLVKSTFGFSKRASRIPELWRIGTSTRALDNVNRARIVMLLCRGEGADGCMQGRARAPAAREDTEGTPKHLRSFGIAPGRPVSRDSVRLISRVPQTAME